MNLLTTIKSDTELIDSKLKELILEEIIMPIGKESFGIQKYYDLTKQEYIYKVYRTNFAFILEIEQTEEIVD